MCARLPSSVLHRLTAGNWVCPACSRPAKHERLRCAESAWVLWALQDTDVRTHHPAIGCPGLQLLQQSYPSRHRCGHLSKRRPCDTLLTAAAYLPSALPVRRP